MTKRDDLISGYAQALFAMADAEGVLEDVEEELFRFAQALEKQTALREALTDQAVPAEQKRAVLDDLLGGKASAHTLRLLGFVVESGHARELRDIVERLGELASERRQSAVADVRAAVALTKAQEDKLAKALATATGMKKVEVRVTVDPDLVGGVVARVGDTVFDGTVKRRLELAREHLSDV